MKCPVCENWSYKDICPMCGYDLENDKEYNNYLYYLSYNEMNKHSEQIQIMKKNYDLLYNNPTEEKKESDILFSKAANADFDGKREIAKHYYELAILEGNVDAYVDLAMLYRTEGIKTGSLIQRFKNYKYSADLLEKAIEYENTDAMMRLAECYLLYFGRFPSIKKALDLYKRAIDLGDMEASSDLVKKYRYGYGILRANYKKADELEDEEFW